MLVRNYGQSKSSPPAASQKPAKFSEVDVDGNELNMSVREQCCKDFAVTPCNAAQRVLHVDLPVFRFCPHDGAQRLDFDDHDRLRRAVGNVLNGRAFVVEEDGFRRDGRRR